MRVGGKHHQYVEEGETNELMSESYSRRSWKGIAIAFLVIGAVAAIVTLIVIYSATPSPQSTEGTLKLADVIDGKYSAKSFGGATWTTGESFVYLKSSKLWQHNISTNESTILVENSTWEEGYSGVYPSPSGKYILYSFNKTKQFRYSYNASFQVVATADKDSPDPYNISKGQLLQYASWGPGDKLVYVFENNIYYLKDYKQSTPDVVTTDGEPGVVFNGVPDWVYEEEVLGSESAIWWSPDGNHFAFMKFNDSVVNDMHYMEYGNPDEYYPTVVDIKYPKPGFPNPEVSVYVVDTSKPNEAKRVDFEEENSHYVTSVTWANNKELAVMWGPRVQNECHISVCSETSGGKNWACKMIYNETSTGWVDARTPLFSEDGENYFIISSNKGFKHLYMGYVNNPEKNIFLTDKDFEVTSIVYYDNNGTIFYIRTDGAEKRRLFYMKGIPDRKESACLSCEADCDWASFSSFSKGTYYALTCSSPTAVPTVRFFRIGDDKPIAVDTWETNEQLKEKLKNQTLADYRDYNAGGDIKVRVWVPKNFSTSKKYPALINVYGGPGSQMIQNSFGIDFGTYLVTNKNYLYVEVDGRGSGFRGDRILFQLYKRLGTVEIEDQIAAMRYLLRNQSFVEPSKVAIWGWSYGGYAAAMTLAKGKDIFTCGMSVAPVTSWRYYDSIYTERYMLEPKDNSESYKTSQLMNYVSDFKNKPFLLLHGTADDNVHIQQTMMLTKALNNASILFDMHIYPDENHSIPKSQLHVYRTLENFLDNCFA